MSHVINGVRTKAELDEVLGGMWAGALDSSNENFARWHECKCSGILCRLSLSLTLLTPRRWSAGL